MLRTRKGSILMTLNQLEQFLVVARLMNISRAAEELYVSHSSISRNISLLEDELQTTLINRDNKVTSLTKGGTLLAERAEFILRYISDTKEEIRAVGAKASTNLKVNVNNVEDPRILKLFSDFRQLRPDARITVTVSDISGLSSTKKLLDKKADIVFTFSFALSEQLDSNIGQLKLYDDEFVALVSDHSPLSKLSAINLKNAKYEPPLRLDNAQFNFVSQIAEPNSFLETEQDHQGCSSLEQMLLQIKYSGRWAIIPRFIALQNQNNCKIIPLEDADSRYSVMLCWNKQNSNPLIRPFLDKVESTFAQA